MSDRHELTRRRMLQLVGAAGVATAVPTSSAAANPVELRLASGFAGGLHFEDAIARAELAEDNDIVSINPVESQGRDENVARFEGEDVDGMVIDSYTLNDVRIDGLDRPVLQGIHASTYDYHWVANAEYGLETLSDLREGGYPVAFPPGFGQLSYAEALVEITDFWQETHPVEILPDELPAAMEGHGVVAAPVYGTNGVELQSWVQELDSVVELAALELDEEFLSAVEEVPGMQPVEFEPYGYQQSITDQLGTDTITGWTIDYQWVLGPEAASDAVYEFARLSHEHADELIDSNQFSADYSDPSALTAGFLSDVDVHPGAAAFFQDYGVWEDDWTVGEAENGEDAPVADDDAPVADEPVDDDDESANGSQRDSEVSDVHFGVDVDDEQPGSGIISALVGLGGAGYLLSRWGDRSGSGE